ncbi:MAG: restriction endonuclease subunit S [Nitrospira sp.]|nr:restriction endonuclease subunit S [Nitrospira sp.]
MSAVDQDAKVITGARELACAEAPSRARQLVRAGDVLVSTVRPNLNSVARVLSEFDGATVSTGFCVLRPRTGLLDGDYLFHWVKSSRFVSEMVRRATGASYPAISDRIVYESKLPFPPLPEQRRIAAILDKADELRAKRRVALAKLDTLTQSIFLDMFGDPATNPKTWQRQKLGDITQKITDGEHLNPLYSETGIPIVMAGDVLEDQIDFRSSRMVASDLGHRFRRKCDPERNDLLIVSRGATIGRLCIVDTARDFCLMGSVILVKPFADKIDSRFLSVFLKHPVSRHALYKASGSSAQQAIYLKDVKNLICIVPPISLQHEFARRVAVIEKIKGAQLASLAELDALFASLQHRAFRGAL